MGVAIELHPHDATLIVEDLASAEPATMVELKNALAAVSEQRFGGKLRPTGEAEITTGIFLVGGAGVSIYAIANGE